MPDRSYYPQTMKRVPEIDLMKALAIIAMVLIHVWEVSSSLSVDSGIEKVTEFVIIFMGGIPSAGVFMLTMGWGAAFSRRSTPKTYLDRMLQLIFLGLLVNFFEHYVPAMIDPERFGPLSEIAPSIIAVDIYFFAPLGMLYFAVMKKFALDRKGSSAIVFSILLVAVCSILNIVLGYETITTGNVWLDTVLGILIRENEWSYFPFISWIIFPVLGYSLATLFRHAKDRSQVLLFAGATGVASIVIAEVLMKRYGIADSVLTETVTSSEASYYALHPLGALCGYGIIALEYVLASVFTTLNRQQIPAVLNYLSRNVMEIYIAQWVLIGLLSPLIARIENMWLNLAVGIAVLIGACFGAKLYMKLIDSLKNSEKIKQYLLH